LCEWQNAKYNVRECLCKGDRIIEIGDREVVLGGLDCGGLCVGEDTIGGEGMELFLLLKVSSGSIEK
jgi:hypothetical protein